VPQLNLTVAIPEGQDAETLRQHLADVGVTVELIVEHPDGVTDSDIVNRIALGLGTKQHWGGADDLEWIANEVGEVRPHPGNDENPYAYGQEFAASTGQNIEEGALVRYVSEPYWEARAELLTCRECHEAQATLDDLSGGRCVPCRTPDRPTDTCGCGHPLLWIQGAWEHDAAPSLWGNDHNPSADDPAPEDLGRTYWDRQDGLLG
jgi:hypothetical protein